MRMNLQQVAGVTGGRIRQGGLAVVVERVSINSRTIAPGETFIALVGPRFNAEDFCEEVVKKGAQGLIVSRNWKPKFEVPPTCFILEVENAELALTDLARAWRQFADPIVVAITGSAGKTTTKEMLAHICRNAMKTHATNGNFNNHIGLPLTLLAMDQDHSLAVLETGMNHRGELTHLASICLPDVAVLTNVGNAHAGNFNSAEEIARAKGELITSLPGSGTAVINADCPMTERLGEYCILPSRIVRFGQRLGADVRADRIGSIHPYGYQFQLIIGESNHAVELKAHGRHQISNALAAAAAAHAIGIPAGLIAERLRTFTAPAMRSQIERRDGWMLIHDYYNASPEAVVTSVRSLRDLGEIRRKLFLFGDMLELGERSKDFHREVGEVVASEGFDMLCTVGPESRAAAEAAKANGVVVRECASPREAGEFLCSQLLPGDALLVKGSRGMKLEEAVGVLQGGAASADGGRSAAHA